MDIKPPSLLVYGSVAYGEDSRQVLDISKRAIGWHRSIRSMGGFWLGNFRLEGKFESMSRYFYGWLGNHFVEKSAGITTWEGMIYEMDLSWMGQTRRRTLDSMRNSWRVYYEDIEGETHVTSAASDTRSINRFGKYEEIATLGQVEVTAAEKKRDTSVMRYSWPISQGVSLAPTITDFAILDVTVSGYIFTANWQFESNGDGTEDEISEWIKGIVGTNCPFLKAGGINGNSIRVYKTNPQPRRAWDVIQELTEMGDLSANPWRFYVTDGRYAKYKKIDTTPMYFVIRDRIGGAGGRLLDPWKVTPGVIRDNNWPATEMQIGSWLTDTRDFYASEVEASVDHGLSVRTELFDEAEILTFQTDYLENNKPPEEED